MPILFKLTLVAVLTPVRHSFDLSPNLSPTRREALKLAPFPSREGGWGLGLTVRTVLRTKQPITAQLFEAVAPGSVELSSTFRGFPPIG